MNEAKGYIATIKWPLIFVALTCLLVVTIYKFSSSSHISHVIIPYVIVSILTVWSGWLININHSKKLIKSAYSGLILFFLFHVVFKSTYFMVIKSIPENETLRNSIFNVLIGISIAYIIATPVIMLLGLIGGYAGNKYKKTTI